MTAISKDRLAALLAKARADKEDKTPPTPSASNIPNSSISKGAITHEPNSLNSSNSNIHRSDNTSKKTSLEALKKKLAARKEIAQKPTEKTTSVDTSKLSSNSNTHIDMNGNAITYNSKQQEFVSLASSGESCVLIGAAGTGKTTCMQGALEALIQTGKIPALNADGHNYLSDGTPGCVIIAYTRRATNNIRKVLPADLKSNAITSHKLLEYAPEYFEVFDEEGNAKKTMRFIATRNQVNPLPNTMATIVVEEASMLSLELYSEIQEALDHKVQWIFLGDINQLPPVFGSAVLGYRILDLPVVELNEVYRQALESPIIRLAHRILSGKPIPPSELESWKAEGQLTLHPWKKKISPDDALRTLAAFFCKTYDAGVYNIEQDVILIPYNKACGTIELNKHIANHIARANNRTTYEIVAGFNKHYFSIGDKVLYDKEDAEIIDISTNAAYTGARFQTESKHLDYWGHNPKAIEEYNAFRNSTSDSEDDIDFLLEAVSAGGEDEERVRKASHCITLSLIDSGKTIDIDTAADINNMLHAYALTVHKSQGSEWRKVYLCFHQSHATMLQRELLYTAVTRAKEELYVICEPETFIKGIESQKIKGNTLEEKAEFFKGKIEDKMRVET